MAKQNPDTEVSDELLEAVQARLAEEHMQVAAHDNQPEDYNSGTEPTSPEVYVESDPHESIPDVQEGAPGTYTGPYEQVWNTDEEEIENRDDLPEGYIPGTYQGEYRPN